MPNPSEKFLLAVQTLAGPPSIQDRLWAAYIHHLVLLDAQEIPSDMRGEFTSLKRDLESGVPLGNEGSVKAFCDKLSDEQAFEYAKKILSILVRLPRVE